MTGSKVLLLPLYMSCLAPDQYGILGVAGSLTVVLILLTNAGLERAVAREYFDYRAHAVALRSYVRSVFLFMGGLNLFAIGVLAAGGMWWGGEWARHAQFAYYPYVPLASGIAAATAFYAVGCVLLQVTERPLAFVGIQITRFVIMVVVIVSLTVQRTYGALGVLLGELIGTGIAAFVLWMVWNRKFLRRKGGVGEDLELRGGWVDVEKLQRAVAYGLPFVGFELGMWVMSGSDRFMLSKYRGMHETGFYTVGATLAAGLSSLTNAVNTAYLPYFFREADRDAGARTRFSRVAELYVLVVGGGCLGGMLFSHEFLGWVGSGRYLPSSPAASILFLSSFAWGLYSLVVLPLLHMKKTTWLPKFVAGAALLNVGLNLVVIPRFGAMGAAWSAVASYGLLFAMAFVGSQRVFPIPYHPGSVWGLLLVVVAVGTLLGDHSLLIRVVGFGTVLILGVCLNVARGNFDALAGLNRTPTRRAEGLG